MLRTRARTGASACAVTRAVLVSTLITCWGCLTVVAPPLTTESTSKWGAWKPLDTRPSVQMVVRPDGVAVAWSTIPNADKPNLLIESKTYQWTSERKQDANVAGGGIFGSNRSSQTIMVFDYVKFRTETLRKIGIERAGSGMVGVAIRVTCNIDVKDSRASYGDPFSLGVSFTNGYAGGSVTLETVGVVPSITWQADLSAASIRELLSKIAVLQSKIDDGRAMIEPCLLATSEQD
jgi:hypothetical protein